MVFQVYSPTGSALGLVEAYESVTWTRRLYEAGEIEIVAPATPEHLALLKDGNIVVRDTTDGDAAIIEGVELERDEEGSTITATGQLLAGVLARRIVAQDTALTGDAESVMLKLIGDNCVSVDAARKIPGMSVPDSQGRGGEVTESKALGKTVLKALTDIAETQGVGYRVLWPSWAVQIVMGLDRTKAQTANPRAILSVEGETLNAISYKHDSAGSVNAATVYCDMRSSGTSLNSFSEAVGSASGLERREIYLTASPKDAVVTVEIRPADKGGGKVVTTDYSAGAINVGKQALAEYAVEDAVSGRTSNLGGLVLRQDFDLGDKVTIVSAEWGIEQDAVITETTETYDAEGVQVEIVFGKRSTVRELLTKDIDKEMGRNG